MRRKLDYSPAERRAMRKEIKRLRDRAIRSWLKGGAAAIVIMSFREYLRLRAK